MKKKNLKIVKLKRKQNFSYRRKVLISDLTLLISIGVHDFEKTKKQEVRFNINIDINPSLFPIEYKLNSIVNYETIIKSIKNITQKKHYPLLETLAEEIFLKLFRETKIKDNLNRILKNNGNL